jgi:hypothetical protein
MVTYRAIREAAKISRDRAAARAETTHVTARLFENAGPDAIKSPALRARLVAVYEDLRKQVEANKAA